MQAKISGVWRDMTVRAKVGGVWLEISGGPPLAIPLREDKSYVGVTWTGDRYAVLNNTDDGVNVWNARGQRMASEDISVTNIGDGAGIVWDGTRYWTSSVTDMRVRAYAPDGTAGTTFTVPFNFPYGLAWDGTNLRILSNAWDLYTFTTAGVEVGTHLDITAITGEGPPRGITYADGLFWIVTQGGAFRVVNSSGVVQTAREFSVHSPNIYGQANVVTGLTFDGTYLRPLKAGSGSDLSIIDAYALDGTYQGIAP